MRIPVRAPVAAMAAVITILAAGAVPATAAGQPGTLSASVAAVSGNLKRYSISGVYVAGVSSGGYMATQLQVAYSSRIRGAAIFAAGPYYCAQNNAAQALYGCADNVYPDHLSTLEANTSLWAAYGWIDPTRNLAGQPVYVFHGGSDTAMRKSVTDDLVRYYQYFGASVQYDSSSPAGHSWVSPLGPVSCTATATPYINSCGTDPENALLRKLFGSVSAANTGTPSGTLTQFDQSAYAVNGYAPGLSMDSKGFVYTPASCASGQSCRLMVALHGCAQQYGAVGTAFVDDAYLNQYADTNRMIVLYPQAAASGVNPNGCWDWWGYLGYTNYPIHGGLQLETIMNMVRTLGG
jgi:poly(3-hydroxybutyrate) depolymerase